MSVSTSSTYVLGTAVELSADLTDLAGHEEDVSGLQWLVRDPSGHEQNLSGSVAHGGTGIYNLTVHADAVGYWYWRVVTTGTLIVAAEGSFEVVSDYSVVGDPTAPVDLRVLVPRARRYCEGPFPDPNRRIADGQLYEMVADACGDIILLSGDLFGRKLVVTGRDGRTGFPLGWATDKVLDEWESALITTQCALNFFFHEFKDKKVSETINNEGQAWTWSLSPIVLRQQFDLLKDTRDRALAALKQWHPTLARFASVLAVRDRQTSAIIEWWAYSNPGQIGPSMGLGGGQEAAVIPVFYPPGK